MRLQSSCWPRLRSLKTWLRLEDPLPRLFTRLLARAFSSLPRGPSYMTSHDINGFPQSKCWERVRITARVRDGKNESTWCRERNTAFFYNLISSDMSYSIGHTEQFYTVWTVWKGTTQGVNTRRWGSLESPWRLTKILFYGENRAIRRELPQALTAILANYQCIFYFTVTVIMNSLSCYLRPIPPTIH